MIQCEEVSQKFTSLCLTEAIVVNNGHYDICSVKNFHRLHTTVFNQTHCCQQWTHVVTYYVGCYLFVALIAVNIVNELSTEARVLTGCQLHKLKGKSVFDVNVSLQVDKQEDNPVVVYLRCQESRRIYGVSSCKILVRINII